MRTQIWIRAWLLAGALALELTGSAPSAMAEDGDVGALRVEIEQLKRIVEQLDSTAQRLEAQHGQPAVPPHAAPPHVAPPPAATAPPAVPLAAPATPVPNPEVTIQERWRRIDHGLTMEQVEALLGRPNRTVPIVPKTVWYYSYPAIGNGSVVFGADGTVSDWQTPPFNTWW